MTTKPTPTPRTQALWMTHYGFANEDQATDALCDFRDHGNALETELAVTLAECERLRQDSAVHRMRLGAILWSVALDKQTCGEVQQWAEDYTAELASLRAENERLKANADRAGFMLKQSPKWDTVAIIEARDAFQIRADRAEAALAASESEVAAIKKVLADFGEQWSPVLTGKITHAGTCYIGEDHIDGVFVQIDREQLKAAPSLPMYRQVAITVLPKQPTASKAPNS